MFKQYERAPANGTWLMCSLTAETWREEKAACSCLLLAPFLHFWETFPHCTGQARCRKQEPGLCLSPGLRWATSLHPWVSGALRPGQLPGAFSSGHLLSTRRQEGVSLPIHSSWAFFNLTARLYSWDKLFLPFTGHFSIHRFSILESTRY